MGRSVRPPDPPIVPRMDDHAAPERLASKDLVVGSADDPRLAHVYRVGTPRPLRAIAECR